MESVTESLVEWGLYEYFGNLDEQVVECVIEHLEENPDLKIILMGGDDEIPATEYIELLKTTDRIKTLGLDE